MRKLFISLMLFSGLVSGNALGDDTDLFLINSALAGSRPNVLIIMDNTANWNNAFSYEKANLKSVIDNLNANINVGLMMFTESGTGNSNTDGAYVRYAIRQMTTTNKNALSSVVNGLDVGNDKSNNQKASLAMDEAYQYYIGGTPYAGNGKVKTDYTNNTYITSPVNATLNALTAKDGTSYFSPMVDNCQQNYIIYISNGKGNENTADLTTATSALSAAGGNTTAITLSDNSFQTNVADEWSRYLANNDIRATQTGHTPDWSGKQTIKTYVVYVRDPNDASGQHPAGWKVLLQSVAANGGGKFYYVNDGSTLKTALDDAFTDMMGVNSVFSSSTLPVSVNVRGTYLNQVYMGVFRPDSNASPRWPGNLKQYQLALDVNNNVYMADATTQKAPVESQGFISPTVTSFWTSKTDSNNPQTWPNGFWDFNYYPQAQSSGGTFDAPDGNLVEKGGAAQKLRNAYATDQSGRKLFTCTGTCTANTTLTTSNNDTSFTTANTNITNTSVGIFTPFTATSITRAGNVATVTATNHGLSTGDAVSITGATPSDYNLVNQNITKIDNNTFTYLVTTSPAYPATGSITGSLAAGVSYPIGSISRTNSGGTTETVTVNMGGSYVANSFASGSLLISGTTPTQYSGTFTVTCQNVGCSQFTYPITLGPSTPGGGGTATAPVTTCASGNKNCTTANTSVTIASIGAKPTDGIVRSGTTVTVTTTAKHGFASSGTVTIAGASPSDYNGTWSFSNASGTSFTISNFPLTPSTPATVMGTASQTGVASITISALTRTNSAVTETVTGTTSTNLSAAPYSLTVGNTFSITISGANETEYNGTKTATLTSASATGSTFTYSVVTTPTTPATGTFTISPGSITRDGLINWVRGQNVKGDDNPSLSTTDVRGYLHGDVLHSRPAVVNYNRSTVTSSTGANEDIVVYYGGNDGILHSVKGGQLSTDGTEKWGFIPSEFFGKFKRLYYELPKVTTSPRDYFVDGPLNVYFNDVNSDNQLISSDTDKVYLYLGMRRGGRFIYGLNVSDPDTPKYMWKKSNSDGGFGELGQTWSDMSPSYIKYFNGKGLSSGSCAALGSPSYDANCSAKNERTATAKRQVLIPALVFGAGYDSTANDAQPQATATMGRGIYILDGRDGSIIWMAGPSKPANFPTTAVFKQVSGMTFSIPSDLTVIDSDNDGYADRAYAPDTGGNIWRVNFDDVDPNNWTVSLLASLAGSGDANARKFLFAPSVVYSTTYDAVLIGSGDREHPLDTTVVNRFYMIKDSHSVNATYAPETGGMATITENDLCDLTSDALQGTDATAMATAQSCIDNSAKKGWFITLSTTGEKTVSASSTVGGIVFFSTNVPASVVASQQCSSLGEARIYALDFTNAKSVIDFTNNSTLDVHDRYTVRDGGGFAPSPTSVAVSLQAADGTTTVKEVTCTGTTCFTPPSKPYLTRYRTYWYKEIDQ
ncbi:type IV pilus assembly protein PilY1 [Novimethylophilus kurashikiensis]|uniref:Type IV pilus assembly protein PilY1 n=1 Tax=Novimethylophilus kurashikiensis TaxID=1825523 RepID=A0A2R5F6I7_9PROT|nr:PilC/PilY family type IV pilus protein [Novimethylophilus kurashikiensis]GBG13880.1 type IV pilus assembly protein PilY1 [Novimethylophilus kurashikiensis]